MLKFKRFLFVIFTLIAAVGLIASCILMGMEALGVAEDNDLSNIKLMLSSLILGFIANTMRK